MKIIIYKCQVRPSSPGCQRLFTRSFQFRSSLQKSPVRKASGPEGHPFDSAEPMTTPLIPKHPESGCFADWFLGDGKCFKCSDWITITIGARSGRGWFKGDKDQIQTILAHVTYIFTSWKRIGNIRSVCVRTEDLDKAGAHLLDKAKAEVIGTFDCVEEISAELRENIVNYIQRKDKLAVLPTSYGKSK